MTLPLNATRSEELAVQIQSKPRQAFENSYRAALTLDKARYVQGFLVMERKPQPIEHSWVEAEDCIIDVNLPFLNQAETGLFYFPAHRLTIAQVKAAVEEAKEDYPEDDPLPVYGKTPYEYYGNVMLGGKDYQSAYKAAEAKCKELIVASRDRN